MWKLKEQRYTSKGKLDGVGLLSDGVINRCDEELNMKVNVE